MVSVTQVRGWAEADSGQHMGKVATSTRCTLCRDTLVMNCHIYTSYLRAADIDAPTLNNHASYRIRMWVPHNV